VAGEFKHPLADPKHARTLVAALPAFDYLKVLDEITGWLESLGQQVTGRRIAVAGVIAGPPDAAAAAPAAAATADKKSALRQQALADAGVQTMLEIFPAEIRDVEEM